MKNTIKSCNLCLLSVQGTHACRYQILNAAGQEFRSLIQSQVMNYVTIICSPFRTDLLYYSKENDAEAILKLWCTRIGQPYTEEMKRRFIRANNEKDTLELYFTSLIHLSKLPQKFNEYKKQLNLVISQEPMHPIHTKLSECDQYLSSVMTCNERKPMIDNNFNPGDAINTKDKKYREYLFDNFSDN